MKNNIKIFLTTILIVIFSGKIALAQKDCSVFKHKFDRNICIAQNAETDKNQETSSTSTNVISDANNKTTSFLKKIGSKFNFKKNKMFRETGD